MAEGNPISFLHVNKPEIDLPLGTDPYSDIVYETGKKNLERFKEEGTLQQDTEARCYIYQQSMSGHVQQGIVMEASVDDYEN
jgi:uncharacterized protein (DUF1015 family)